MGKVALTLSCFTAKSWSAQVVDMSLTLASNGAFGKPHRRMQSPIVTALRQMNSDQMFRALGSPCSFHSSMDQSTS